MEVPLKARERARRSLCSTAPQQKRAAEAALSLAPIAGPYAAPAAICVGSDRGKIEGAQGPLVQLEA
jgi:hypothetical protein